MNNIIHRIKEYIPNENIQFRRNENSGYIEVLFTRIKGVITILENNTWEEIKRHIDAKLNSNNNIYCSICLDDMKNKKVSCPKCANYWCVDCYINIFRVNKGIIKCPYCRFQYGHEASDEQVEQGILEIYAKTAI